VSAIQLGGNMKYKTVGFKGSKRKLLDTILNLTLEVEDAESFYDGFSGSGIVSAHMRQNGFEVVANDKAPSATLFADVFLNGFDKDIVESELKTINGLTPTKGWLFKNYSGEYLRNVRGQQTPQWRPRAFSLENGKKLDAAFDYIHSLPDSEEKRALLFSGILAMNGVFNGTNDQKSSLAEWTNRALKPVRFEMPTLVTGIKGKAENCSILESTNTEADVVYLDPPYTTGVLYDACYHLNDSAALWDKPAVDNSYALPRPDRVCFKKNQKCAGSFYMKDTVRDDFDKLLGKFDCKRIILSYSNGTRNAISFSELLFTAQKHGNVVVYDKSHKICMQPKSMKKQQKALFEYFFVIDK
jgi:adenine-specific DNA methylase